MKKILLFAILMIAALGAQAQSTAQIDRMADKEMDKLIKIVTYNNDNLTFTTNQKAKLERVLHQKATEIVNLKNSDVGKIEFSEAYTKIGQKYDPKVEEILTTVQRIEYKRNKNKRIVLKKD